MRMKLRKLNQRELNDVARRVATQGLTVQQTEHGAFIDVPDDFPADQSKRLENAVGVLDRNKPRAELPDDGQGGLTKTEAIAQARRGRRRS